MKKFMFLVAIFGMFSLPANAQYVAVQWGSPCQNAAISSSTNHFAAVSIYGLPFGSVTSVELTTVNLDNPKHPTVTEELQLAWVAPGYYLAARNDYQYPPGSKNTGDWAGASVVVYTTDPKITYTSSVYFRLFP